MNTSEADTQVFSKEPPRALATAAASDRRVPAKIGPYKILQQIGRGGMGQVYMAEQEHPVRRRVALKIIKSESPTKEILARFEAERQALAMMDHQNIAKVLDAGITEQGLPYFAMELVKGVAITHYCDQNRLSPAARLDLFIQACRAIQHAHHKGIVHRDIKPSNMLVTLYDGKPVTKVIDFGLAKALHDQTRLTDRTMFTQFGQVVGTLEYMSPEQAEMNSLDIDTRTDVYSLGVILYELLTGSTPIGHERLRTAALDTILRMIREEEPQRPSARLSGCGDAATGISQQRCTDPKRLSLILKGDLDWIAMKALEKDRTRRYDGPGALADDVQRYLNNEAIVARPPSLTYRLQKTFQKNRPAIIGILVLVALLVLGFTTTTYLWMKARTASQLAEKKSQDALVEKNRADAERQLAEAERARADDQTRAAQASARLAEEREAAAKAAKTEAENERLRTQQANQKLNEAIDETDKRISRSNYLLAGVRWTENRAAEALRLLDEIPVQHRGFEWYVDRKLYTRSLATLANHESEVFSLDFSPDGKRLATACNDGKVRIWSTNNYRLLLTIPSDLGILDHVCFDSQGKWLAFGGNAKRVLVWDSQMAQPKFDLTCDSEIQSLAFNPDGQLLVAGTGSSVVLWDKLRNQAESTDTNIDVVKDQEQTTAQVFASFPSQVSHVQFSKDGQYLFVSCNDATISKWNVATRSRESLFQHGTQTTWLGKFAISADGKHLVSCGGDREARVWDLESGQELGVLRGHNSGILSATFIPNSDLVATSSNDSTIRIWDFNTCSQQNVIGEHSARVGGIGCSPDGSLLASTSDDRTAKLWSVHAVESSAISKIRSIPLTTHAHGVAFDHQDDKLYVPFNQGIVSLRSTDSELPSQFTVDLGGGSSKQVSCLHLSSDGSKMALGDTLGGVSLAEVTKENVEVQFSLNGTRQRVYSLCFNSDYSLLAAGGEDGNVDVWDLTSREVLYRIAAHKSAVTCITRNASRDEWITCSHGEKNAAAWSIKTGRQTKSYPNTSQNLSIAVSSDGKLLVTGSQDEMVRIWDPDTCSVMHTLRGHGGAVNHVIFSPKGDRIISGDADGTIKIWDSASGEELRSYVGHEGQISTLAMNATGTALASCACLHDLKIWSGAGSYQNQVGRSFWRTSMDVPVSPGRTQDISAFDHLIKDFLKNNQIPGATLAVGKEGQPIYSRGYGYADFNNRITMQVDTPLRVAGVTKVVTALAVMRLVEAGKVDLQERLVDIFADQLGELKLAEGVELITVQHLLQNTSSLGSSLQFDPLTSSEIDDKLALGRKIALVDILRYVVQQPLAYKPGEQFAYSDLGYAVLGNIIQRKSGQPYVDFVRSEIFQPLEMHQSRFGSGPDPMSNTAPGVVYYGTQHDYLTNDYPIAAYEQGSDLRGYSAAGGLVTSAADLIKIACALDPSAPVKLLGPQSIRQLVSRPDCKTWSNTSYYFGMGFYVRPVGTSQNVWHLSGIDGSGALLVLRDDRITWALVFNKRDSFDARDAAGKIDPLLHVPADYISSYDRLKQWSLTARSRQDELDENWKSAASNWREVYELRLKESNLTLAAAAYVSYDNATRLAGDTVTLAPDPKVLALCNPSEKIVESPFTIRSDIQKIGEYIMADGYAMQSIEVDVRGKDIYQRVRFLKNRPIEIDDWEARSYLDQATYDAKHKLNTSEGWRQIQHSTYNYEGSQFHVGIWIKKDPWSRAQKYWKSAPRKAVALCREAIAEGSQKSGEHDIYMHARKIWLMAACKNSSLDDLANEIALELPEDLRSNDGTLTTEPINSDALVDLVVPLMNTSFIMKDLQLEAGSPPRFVGTFAPAWTNKLSFHMHKGPVTKFAELDQLYRQTKGFRLVRRFEYEEEGEQRFAALWHQSKTELEAQELNDKVWKKVIVPSGQASDTELQQLRNAVAVQPRGVYLNTLGLAEYRASNFAAAIESCQLSLDLTPKEMNYSSAHPTDLAILVMANLKLDKLDEATKFRQQLLEAMKRPEFATNPECIGLTKEADALFAP